MGVGDPGRGAALAPRASPAPAPAEASFPAGIVWATPAWSASVPAAAFSGICCCVFLFR